MFLFCNISIVWLVIMKGDTRLLILIANSKTWQESFLNLPQLQRAEVVLTNYPAVAENNIKLEPSSPLSPLPALWSVAASALWSVAPQVRILKLNQKHHTQPTGLISPSLRYQGIALLFTPVSLSLSRHTITRISLRGVLSSIGKTKPLHWSDWCSYSYYH